MRWSIGSTWHRWDPHIHAPGTLKENQYGSHTDPAVWDRYFAKIRETQPACSAIGITDYFVPRGYRLFVERGGRAQLPGLFVFPNVELRLVTRTLAGHALNVHLLVSPDDPDHLGTLTEKLSALTFPYDGDDYRCTEADLRRLGKRVNPGLFNDDEGALRAGAEQFLVNAEHFTRLKEQAWIRQHVLFAVPAGNDGLSGVKGDAFKALREELGRIADVVFSGSPNDVQGKSMLDLGQWLYSTDHISIRYSIRYEGRDIANLSPGARGVVLLTLFLAIDDHDDRPLVIDQPEENLDPKSINGLLVPFFVGAAKRRQIIMVTHNANLVVNTDADQVVVATSARSDVSDLPVQEPRSSRRGEIERPARSAREEIGAHLR
jgi:hypothetical protein